MHFPLCYNKVQISFAFEGPKKNLAKSRKNCYNTIYKDHSRWFLLWRIWSPRRIKDTMDTALEVFFSRAELMRKDSYEEFWQ